MAISAIVVFFAIGVFFPPVGCGMMVLCPPPAASTIPLLGFLDVWDSLAFGVGVAILIYAGMTYSKWPPAIRTPLLILLFIALWFTLLNWIHDGWHKVAGMNLNNVVFIEYVFHVPWFIFSLLLVYAITKIVIAYSSKSA